jgi:hypothetical protein
MIDFMTVDLPEPFGPMRPRISQGLVHGDQEQCTERGAPGWYADHPARRRSPS